MNYRYFNLGMSINLLVRIFNFTIITLRNTLLQDTKVFLFWIKVYYKT